MTTSRGKLYSERYSGYFEGHSGFSGVPAGPKFYRWQDRFPEEAAEIVKLKQEREENRAKEEKGGQAQLIRKTTQKTQEELQKEEEHRRNEECRMKREASHRRWSRRLRWLALAFLLVCSLFGFLVHITP